MDVRDCLVAYIFVKSFLIVLAVLLPVTINYSSSTTSLEKELKGLEDINC